MGMGMASTENESIIGYNGVRGSGQVTYSLIDKINVRKLVKKILGLKESSWTIESR